MKIGLKGGIVYALWMVINNIVANSFKHDFPGNRQGRIRRCLLRGAGQEFSLMVGDDGIRMPSCNDPEKLSSLGLRLITGMVQKQLKDALAIDNAGGTYYRIGFRVQGGS